MAYVKQTWATGQVVTASKLNHMEEGIAEADAAAASAASAASGKYSKPSGGIPSTDMTSEVQASLAKADAAQPEIDSDNKLDISLVSGYTTKEMVVEYDDDTPTETFDVVVMANA